MAEFLREWMLVTLQILRENWRRDLAALPISTLILLIAAHALFGDLPLPELAAFTCLAGVIVWPISWWIVDRTLRRKR